MNFDHFVIARALHILAVVLWIGGVAFVTGILIPALKQLTQPEQRLALFERLEGRFAKQAKITTLVTGLSGLYMLEFLNAWGRYLEPQFWWLHLMTFIWFIFTLVLFVFEPLFLHKLFHKMAEENSELAFKRLHLMHIILLSVSLLAVVAGMAGAHGLI
jgi:uncharacterized membrane protein